MREVDITVNERVYKVTCDDGQEPRLHRLAAHIDGHVRRRVGELGQIGDVRLILLAALTVCDDLFDAKERLVDIESGAALDPETIGGAAQVIDAAAKRVDGLAARLQDLREGSAISRGS